MTNEEQRIAIAKACGWHRCGPHPNTNSLVGFPKDVEPSMDDWEVVPNYLNDLNAMHKVEKVLTFEQWSKYVDHLIDSSEAIEDIPIRGYESIHATAAQRAEAFLRTLNLWKD